MTSVTVRVSFSGSLSGPPPLSARRLPPTAVSSSVAMVSGWAVGGWLGGTSVTPAMSRVAVAVLVPPLPSEMV